ncbi:Glycerol kinase [Streptomyces tendae]
MADFIGAVDQGTTSTRFMIFDHGGNEVAKHQLEHEQILPRSGWVEHDPVEIWERTNSVMQNALRNGGLSGNDLAAIGITNQRETTVVWDPRTGRPYYNAIVWQDTRTDAIAANLERSGRATSSAARRGCRPRRTSPAGDRSGSSRTSTASARRRNRDTRCSATRTPGSCGT